jgi:hypothetical protein
MGEEFRGLIRNYMEKRHVRRLEDIRQHTTLSVATFSKYWNDPAKFPLGEVVAIFNYLKIPYEERAEILNK